MLQLYYFFNWLQLDQLFHLFSRNSNKLMIRKVDSEEQSREALLNNLIFALIVQEISIFHTFSIFISSYDIHSNNVLKIILLWIFG